MTGSVSGKFVFLPVVARGGGVMGSVSASKLAFWLVVGRGGVMGSVSASKFIFLLVVAGGDGVMGSVSKFMGGRRLAGSIRWTGLEGRTDMPSSRSKFRLEDPVSDSWNEDIGFLAACFDFLAGA